MDFFAKATESIGRKNDSQKTGMKGSGLAK